MTQLRLSFSATLMFIFLSAATISAQTGNTTLGTGAGASITTGDYDTMLGDSAGTNLTSGLNNTFVGEQAGFSQTTAADNTFIGQDAGRSNTTGTDNTFIGKRAGYFSTATDNTFLGTEAGEANTSGSDNTFLGEEAGQANTTGRDNTFVGEDAGFNNTDGDDNTFVGSTAGRTNTTGYRNTAVGNEAGYDFSTGHHVTAVGDSAGTDNGAGHHNAYFGAAAGAATEHGDYNTMLGAYAGWDNNRTNNTSNANRNTYTGAYAGFTNREGEDNVGMGAFSNFSGTNRSRCTFIGASSLASNNDVTLLGYETYSNKQYAIAIGSYADCRGTNSIVLGTLSDIENNSDNAINIGYFSLMAGAGVDGSVSIGSQNYAVNATNSVAIGALDSLLADSAIIIGSSGVVSGVHSIGIGQGVRVSGINSAVIGKGSTVLGSNSIAIGSGVTLASNNEVYLGNTATASIGGIVNWTATSDGRFKHDVKENVAGLDFIDRLRPVTYHFDGETLGDFLNHSTASAEMKQAYLDKSKVRYTGFIAQEVADAADAADYNFSGVDRPKDATSDIYGLRYAEFVVPLVKATQELHAQVQDLQQIVDSQQTELASKDDMLDEYRSALIQLTSRVEALEADNAVHIDTETNDD